MNATMRIALVSSNSTDNYYVSIEIMSRENRRNVIKINMSPKDYADLITGLLVNVDLNIKGEFANAHQNQ